MSGVLDVNSLGAVFALGFACPIIVLSVPYLAVSAALIAWRTFSE